jgi:YidC/Oxa1 family membrane protein insertase
MNYNILNLIAAIAFSVAIIFGWQHFYEKPRLAKLAVEHKIYNNQIESAKQTSALATTIPQRTEAVTDNDRVKIKSSTLKGSITLKGLRFDDLVLLDYKQDLSPESKNVELFSPASCKEAYFAELGWFSSNNTQDLPSVDTIWQADTSELTPETPLNLSWSNSKGVKFQVNIALDAHYLFTIKQTIINNSSEPVIAQSYGLINHNYYAKEKLVNILHQGPIGVIADQLKEYSYDDIKDKKTEKFALNNVDWIGITDKYWLAAFIPDKASVYSSNFNYAVKGGFEKFQADFIAPTHTVNTGEEVSYTHRLFAGAKQVKLLDKYTKELNIKLFDRAIDFGWFYVLTKPVFNAMSFFYSYVGNFGISILIVTVIIKLLMFTLANKSYRSMKKMKKLQPEIERIKNLYGDDKAKLNQEIMLLYKKQKVNPATGCLPLFVQIPVFFSIYKVLYVTIEMRHAPFYGWIKDLSAPDPTTVFNLFGLLPFTPPSMLMIGAWPIIMAVTMFLQQRMGPAPTDPTQAQVMKFMPLIFLVMFSSFPAGLLIYWSWNNILSIIQQYYINKMDRS